jgi:uncharacterized membrane protein YbaN (DUF454 family)
VAALFDWMSERTECETSYILLKNLFKIRGWKGLESVALSLHVRGLFGIFYEYVKHASKFLPVPPFEMAASASLREELESLKKVFFACAGVAMLGLGALGTVVPGLPTTPLLLLALYCFAKGSERLSRWFRGTKMYHRYLSDYVETKSMTRKQKLSIQLLATTMMTISFIIVDVLAVRIFLVVAFFSMNYIFIFRIKVRDPKPRKTPRLVSNESRT